MKYQDFIQSKQFQVSKTGFVCKDSDINAKLFPFQKDVVRWAIGRGNALIGEDCGLGKTPQQLNIADFYAKKTNKPAMILAPLAVSQQTVHEGEKFGINVNICKNQKDIVPGVNITNYERIHKFDLSICSHLGLDEASILKNYMGKIKRQLVDIGKHIPYKFTYTATPAPNDHLELLNQAEYLRIMTSSMALAIWFINKTNELGGYRLKKHAEESFWQWVSSWAVYLNAPSDLGYDNDGFNLPPLQVHDHEVQISEIEIDIDNGSFLRDISLNATSYNREKKKTLKARCEKTAQIIHEHPGKQFVIWVERNDEGQYLRKLLPDAVEIKGSDNVDKKEEVAMSFVRGEMPLLITKPSIFGYGLNFQHCADTIFCGLSFSYENYYQSVRRFWRFGQKNPVNVHIVYGSTEKGILQIVRAKEEKHHELQAAMFGRLKDIQSKNFFNKTFKTDYVKAHKMLLPNWI